jgi:hypothetical protein
MNNKNIHKEKQDYDKLYMQYLKKTQFYERMQLEKEKFLWRQNMNKCHICIKKYQSEIFLNKK